MAVMNPCCCKLQLGATIVAVVNMVLAVATLVCYLVALLIGVVATATAVSLNEQPETGLSRSHDDTGTYAAVAAVTTILVIISILVVISCAISFALAVFLFIGARTRNFFKCRLWFAVSLFFLGLFVLFKLINIGTILVVAFAAEGISGGAILFAIMKEIGGLIFGIAIQGYQLWVVYAFMDEVKREQNSSYRPEDGVVHYQSHVGDNPPPYGQGGYGPYVPSQSASESYPQKPVYPLLSSEDRIGEKV